MGDRRLFIYVLGRGEGAVDFSRARGRVHPAQGDLSKSKFSEKKTYNFRLKRVSVVCTCIWYACLYRYLPHVYGP